MGLEQLRNKPINNTMIVGPQITQSVSSADMTNPNPFIARLDFIILTCLSEHLFVSRKCTTLKTLFNLMIGNVGSTLKNLRVDTCPKTSTPPRSIIGENPFGIISRHSRMLIFTLGACGKHYNKAIMRKIPSLLSSLITVTIWAIRVDLENLCFGRKPHAFP